MDSEISDFEEDVILPNSPLGQYLSDFTASENDPNEYCKLSVKNINNNFKREHDICNKLTCITHKIFDVVKLYFDYLYSAFVPSVRLFEHSDLKSILKYSNFSKVLLSEDNSILQNYEADENVTGELGLTYATVFQQCFQLLGLIIIYLILKSVTSINNIVDSYLIQKLSDNFYFLYALLKILLWFVPKLFLINIFIIIVFIITNIIELLFCKKLCYSIKKKLQGTENIIIVIKKCIRLIQEAELIARGFTYASIPGIVERLELSAGLPITLPQRQYPELRKHIFSWCRNIFMLYRSSTQFLIESKMVGPALDISSQSLAELDLKEFGDLLKYNTDSDANMQELLKLTDNLSVSSLKTIYLLAEFQISEFFKYLYLITSFVVIDNDLFHFTKRIKHFYTLNSALNYLHGKQSDVFKLVCKMYKYYKSIEILSDVEDKSMIPLKINSSPLEINVHNMSLHLKAALRKLTALEELFENKKYSNELCKEELLRKVEVISKQIKSEIDAYNEYYQKCNSEVQDILYGVKKQSVKTSVSDEFSKDHETAQTIIISRCDMEPDIEDEIFEAIATKSASNEDCQVFPAEVNKDIEVTGKLLHELKNVLIVKADEHRRREDRALAKRFNKEELQLESCLFNNASNGDKNNDEVEPCLSNKTENPNISTPLLDTENSQTNFEYTCEEDRKTLNNSLQFNIASAIDSSFSASVAALALHRQKILGISNDTCFSDENNSDDEELT